MGLRLKSQLVVLCLTLMLVTLGALTYFHLTISSQDNLMRSDRDGRRVALQAFQQVQLFVQASSDANDLVACLSGPKASTLAESLGKTPDLIQFDVFLPSGSSLMSSGSAAIDDLSFQQALFWVQSHHESYNEIWGYENGKVEPLVTVGPFYRGQVVHHSYHALYNNSGALEGLVHLAVKLPKAPRRINFILIGYLTIAAIFLVSSVLAIYLWAEFALNRPLRGLNNSLQQLHNLDPAGSKPDSLPQPNELSEAARALNHVTLDLVKYQQELQQKTVHLERLNEDLEQKVADKTLQIREFFSLVTHDLRVPLAAVAGYADLIENPRSGQLSEKQTRYLHSIQVANRDAQELVRNMLEAMKYEFSQPAMQPEEFDVSELVGEIAEQLKVMEKPMEVVVDPGQNLSILGDRVRIGRVFSNLLSNALHHAGHVKVELSAEARSVAVVVSDQGPGIAAEDLPRLFEKFKGSSSGLGLGLYIVHRILKDHGQDIQVDSTPGQGTRFSFHLARAEKEPSS
ncbi:MAG: HAMP domain-containing histidine kinase [Candidatus Eremiobacteraeota bacterium]|nr:HAMP domain-containing histidine kinase [Candidatus Eremiobacteraeota bacterium]